MSLTGAIEELKLLRTQREKQEQFEYVVDSLEYIFKNTKPFEVLPNARILTLISEAPEGYVYRLEPLKEWILMYMDRTIIGRGASTIEEVNARYGLGWVGENVNLNNVLYSFAVLNDSIVTKVDTYGN